MQEYIQRFSDLLLKSSGLLPHHAKDLAHITCFIRNLHNQKLHYILGKNPISVQNTITLGQKKDTELKIIQGLHNHDLSHEINNIYPSQIDKPNKIGPCHAYNGPPFIKDCDETMRLRCKPNLDNHMSSKCPRKCHPNTKLSHNTLNNNNVNRHKINQYTKPNLQLSVLTNKQDQMAELLKATRKMTKYFKRSLKHTPSHPNRTNNHQSNMSTSHSDKHKCNSYYCKDKANEISTDTYTPNHIAPEIDSIPNHTDVDNSDSITDSASDSE